MAAVVIQVKKSVPSSVTETVTLPEIVINESETDPDLEQTDQTGTGPTGVARPFIDDENSVTEPSVVVT